MVYRQTADVEARLNDNRSRILKVAQILVSNGGWKEAQITNVATTANMATGTIYRYFPSKVTLFVEVLSRVSQREVDVLKEISISLKPAPEKLYQAVSTFVIRAMINPRLAYALIAEPCEKELDEARLKYRSEISKVIKTIILEGQKSDLLRTDIQPDIAATVIVGGFMEALIGPLSPLNQIHKNSIDYQEETQKVAEQIAKLTCLMLVKN